MKAVNLPTITRRGLLMAGTSTLALSVLPEYAHASPTDLEAAKAELFGTRPVKEGRVSISLPALSENGYSVPIIVTVESPMTPDQYVQRIVILSERNPIPIIGIFQLSSYSGKAEVSTRVRLSGTQTVTAIAEMNDGSLWSGTAHTVVTLAACIIL